MSGQQHAPGHNLLPGKTRYPLYRRLGGPQGRSGRAENLVPTGIRCPDRPARSSQSLYRQSYPAHKRSTVTNSLPPTGQGHLPLRRFKPLSQALSAVFWTLHASNFSHIGAGLGGGGSSVEGNGRKIPPTPKLRLSVYRLSHNYQFRKGINMVVVRTALERNRYEIRESGWKLTPLSKIWLSLRECSRNTRVLGRP